MRRWRAVAATLAGCRPSHKLKILVKYGVLMAEREYRAAERRLFDVFDIAASDLLTVEDCMSPAEQREHLVERAEFHAQWSRDVAAPEHAAMHRRLAKQLAKFIDELDSFGGIDT